MVDQIETPWPSQWKIFLVPHIYHITNYDAKYLSIRSQPSWVESFLPVFVHVADGDSWHGQISANILMKAQLRRRLERKVLLKSCVYVGQRVPGNITVCSTSLKCIVIVLIMQLIVSGLHFQTGPLTGPWEESPTYTQHLCGTAASPGPTLTHPQQVTQNRNQRTLLNGGLSSSNINLGSGTNCTLQTEVEWLEIQ